MPQIRRVFLDEHISGLFCCFPQGDCKYTKYKISKKNGTASSWIVVIVRMANLCSFCYFILSFRLFFLLSGHNTSRNRISIFQPCFPPPGRRGPGVFLESPDEMARRLEARPCRNLGNRKFRVPGKNSFRAVYTETGNPFTEGYPVRRPYVSGQIGPVGMQHIGKFLDGKSRTDISVRIDPFRDFRGHFRMPGGKGGCLMHFLSCSAQCLFFRGYLAFHGGLHLLVEQQVIQITAEKISVEGHG